MEQEPLEPVHASFFLLPLYVASSDKECRQLANFQVINLDEVWLLTACLCGRAKRGGAEGKGSVNHHGAVLPCVAFLAPIARVFLSHTWKRSFWGRDCLWLLPSPPLAKQYRSKFLRRAVWFSDDVSCRFAEPSLDHEKLV